VALYQAFLEVTNPALMTLVNAFDNERHSSPTVRARLDRRPAIAQLVIKQRNGTSCWRGSTLISGLQVWLVRA
jgi:hypothetical protein